MRKSARILGQEYGVTSQEMNYILKKQGYLSGDAGGYSVTEKGAPFADEQDYHRGTGGYAQYNKYWTTRTWDDGIKDELCVTSDLISEARESVASTRRQQWDDIKKARTEANAAFLARQDNGDTDSCEYDEPYNNDSNTSDVALIIGGLLVLGYGIYKAAPHVVKWWKDAVAPKLGSSKKMLCPSCGGIMKLNLKSTIWKCDSCNYCLSDKALNDGEVFWFCDKCEAFLNTQQGFNTESGHWKCSKCSFDNDVTGANIDK